MASKPEIINEIEGLTVHCRPPLMEADSRAGWLRDWCDDLAEFPIEFIRAAIRDWRQGGNTKFPTPGQILPLIRAKVPVGKTGQGPEPWRPLDDAEYAALSLREKIRHQLIQASEARRKAGPMFKNTSGVGKMRHARGIHLRPEEMPDTWRRWTGIAEQHEAEAQRLRGYLHAKPMAAE